MIYDMFENLRFHPSTQNDKPTLSKGLHSAWEALSKTFVWVPEYIVYIYVWTERYGSEKIIRFQKYPDIWRRAFGWLWEVKIWTKEIICTTM